MPTVKIGALCWNQYADWPSLLQAGIRADGSATTACGRGTTCTRSSATRRAELRGLADDHRLGPGDEARHGRADGRGEQVPRPDAHGEDGDDARPHQRRPRDPRHRRRLVRGGARGVRARLRVRVPRAPPLAGRGAAGHARDARRHRADGARPALHVARHAEPAGADPGASPDLHRRRRRAGDAQARRPVRRHEQRRWRGRAASGARRRSSSGTARRSGATRPRSSGRPASGRCSSATTGRRRSGCSGRRSGERRRQPLDRPAGGHAGGRGQRLAPKVALGYRHLIMGMPALYDEESMTRFATEVRPLLERG